VRPEGFCMFCCRWMTVALLFACSLPMETGGCQNYTLKWYFDSSKKECSRFWFGGCDGNDNKFESWEKTHSCLLLSKAQPCTAELSHGNTGCFSFIHSHYLSVPKSHTYVALKKDTFAVKSLRLLCFQVNDIPVLCFQANDKSSAIQWFYNRQVKRCAVFWYGGCDGNGNRFPTQAACRQLCVAQSECDIQKRPTFASINTSVVVLYVSPDNEGDDQRGCL
uniref:BPTI/Kunitz inhibitor domain-containing protein n=1 Tax=Paramormyrops kingsleyae TaxID=1676925 RepID=A0A3B3SUN5_9TELE